MCEPETLKEAAIKGRPRLAYSICGVTVFLASSMHKNFYFRHRTEDGSCPAVTRLGLTEADIRAMKYRGAQESEAYKRIKQLGPSALLGQRFTVASGNPVKDC